LARTPPIAETSPALPEQPAKSRSIDEPPPDIPGFNDLVEIGSGASGRVYRAWQVSLGRTVALKVLTRDCGQGPDSRAHREARALAVLNHPQVITIHESALQHQPPFLVMEWIAGGSLQDRLRQGPLGIAEATRLAWQLASGVAACHAHNIVHRDLKPGNVLLARDSSNSGGELCVKISDFGLVHQPEHSIHLTQEGAAVGTPGYMAPEQTGLRPQLGPIGPGCDIYGVGAVVFAALTGRPPHVGATHLETLHHAAWDEPLSLPRLRPDVPADLAVIIGKCLRTEPADRYGSARELLDDLERFLAGQPILAREYSLWQRTRNGMRRRPTLTAVGLLTALLLLTGVIGGVFHVVRVNAALADLENERTRTVQLLSETKAARDGEFRHRERVVRQAAVAIELLLNMLTPDPTLHAPQPQKTVPTDLQAKGLAALRQFHREQLSPPEELGRELSELVGRSLNRIASLESNWLDREADTLSDSELAEQVARRFPDSPILVGCELRALALQLRIRRIQSRPEEAHVVLQRLTELLNRLEAHAAVLPLPQWNTGLASDLWTLGRPEDALRLLNLAIRADERLFATSPQSMDAWNRRLAEESLRVGLLQNLGRHLEADHHLRCCLALSRDCEAAYPERSDTRRAGRWRMVTEQLRQAAPVSSEERLQSLLELGKACLEEFRQTPSPGRQQTAAALDWCLALLESPQHLLQGAQVEQLTEEILRSGEALDGLAETPEARLPLGRVRALLGEWAFTEEQYALALHHARLAQQHLDQRNWPPLAQPNREPWRATLFQACDLAARASDRLGLSAEELSHLSRAWSLASEAEREKLAPRLPAFVATGTRRSP
jgi:tetratricopeptide (TPR) repeat protein